MLHSICFVAAVSQTDNPPAMYTNSNTVLPSSGASNAPDSATPLVLHADRNTTPQEEHPRTVDIRTMPNKVRIIHS